MDALIVTRLSGRQRVSADHRALCDAPGRYDDALGRIQDGLEQSTAKAPRFDNVALPPSISASVNFPARALPARRIRSRATPSIVN